MRNRGVSDVIGFVLIVSIVLTTVGAVYVTGFSGLEDARQAEAANNVERAFDVFDDNMADIYRSGAPNRATEFKLSDSQIGVGSTSTTIEVEITGNSNDEGAVDVNPVTYTMQDGDTRYVYELGAVFRENRDGAVMIEEPPFLFEQDRTVLQYVVTRSQTSQSRAGSTTVLVRGERTSRVVKQTPRVGVDGYGAELTVTTTPKRAPAWERYLESEIGWTSACTIVGSNEVECDLSPSNSPDKLYITSTGIELEIE